MISDTPLANFGKPNLSSVEKLQEPRKIVLEEIERGWVLLQGRDCMHTDSTPTERVIATGPTAHRDAANRTATEGEAANGPAAEGDEDADSPTSNGNKA